MASEVDQIFFHRAQWRLAMLIPTWLLSLTMSLVLMGIFAYRLAETIENWEESGKKGNLPEVELTWECTNVAFSLIALVLSVVEISKYANEVLTPFFLLCTQLVKITLSLAILGLDITAYLQHDAGVYSPIGLAIDCAQIAVTVASLIYAATSYRHLLKYEDYHMTAGAKFDGYQDSHDRNMCGSPHTLGTRGANGGRARSASDINNPSVGYESQTAGLGLQVNEAMGAEFGWSALSREGARAGAVNTATAQSRNDLPRAQSWMSQKGVVTAEENNHGGEPAAGSHDQVRRGHGRIPSVVISKHGEQGHDEEDDTRALLAHEGDVGERSMDAQYRDHLDRSTSDAR